MKKKEYKAGDVIRVNEAKFDPLWDKLRGLEKTLEFISNLYGEAHKALWDLVKEEYPGLIEGHRVSYSLGKLTVGEKRHD